MQTADICRRCQGKCCHEEVFLVQSDLDRLKRLGKSVRVKKNGAGFDMLHDGKCPLLNEKTGCTLNEATKPFDCLLFPLAFIYQKGKVTFYLNKKCPYYYLFPSTWIKKTKKWALGRLKEWSENEKKTYSQLIQTYSSADLIPV